MNQVPQLNLVNNEINEIKLNRRDKKDRVEKRPKVEEEIKRISQEIYIRWKSNKLMRERNYTHEQAIHKSEERWKKESAEVTRLFYKAAVIENTILGDEDITTRKKKRETKRKENQHPYLLFCKENREEVAKKFKPKEVLTELSKMWKALSEDEKQKYIVMAKRNKEMEQNEQNDIPTQVTHAMPSVQTVQIEQAVPSDYQIQNPLIQGQPPF